MMFLKRLAMLFYVTLALFLGCFILLYVLNLIDYQSVMILLSAVYYDEKLKLVAACLGGVILFSNFLFYQFLSVNVHRDKIIAFDNPGGRVTVSLGAIEDLVRRMLLRLNEIKDIKVNMIASKSGLDVNIRLSLAQEVNIPDITSIIQQRSKKKIQDTIGMEEALNISVYVGRIYTDKNKNKNVKDIEDEGVHTLPFQGYRA